MLSLYFTPGSSSMAAHIALHETGAPFESRYLLLNGVQNKTSEYLALNPEGKVPTLLIDGRPLTEVAAILFYLARTFPAANLMPVNDLEAEARVLSWMSFIAATVHPARRQGLDRLRAALGVAELRLGDRDWAVGDFSIADIHLFRLFWRFANSPGGDAALFPRLARHYDRMMQRPAVRQTIAIESALGYRLPA